MSRPAISSPGSAEVIPAEDAPLRSIARSLEPLIREHAQALEERRIPPPLVEGWRLAALQFSSLGQRERSA